jgi:adenylylsulfate kinase
MRILIMGLPGSGKTTLATQLAEKLGATHFNADQVREQFNDWDFSNTGRIRQSLRMRELCDLSESKYCIADFVCPLKEMRDNFAADITIWVDTIKKGRFADTNQAFIPPKIYDYRVTEQDAERWALVISRNILNM